MNQSDSRGSAGQSADLRTRIAAAIRAVDDMRVCKLHDADIKFITEAVIRELEPELNRHNTGCVCDDCWPDQEGD